MGGVKSPVTVPAGFMAPPPGIKVNSEPGGSNTVMVPLGVLRKPCAAEKSGVVLKNPTIVPPGLMA